MSREKEDGAIQGSHEIQCKMVTIHQNQERNYLDGAIKSSSIAVFDEHQQGMGTMSREKEDGAIEDSQEIQCNMVTIHQNQERNYLEGAIKSSSIPVFDEHQQGMGTINQPITAIHAPAGKNIAEDDRKVMSIVAAAPAELMSTKKIFDIKFLPSWLFAKEQKSFKAYFEKVTTPKNEVSWKKDAGLATRRYSKSVQKRERAQRTACRLLLINGQVPNYLRTLLKSVDNKKEEWGSVNAIHDLAKRYSQMKYAMGTDCETLSVLLLRLIMGADAYTKLKILRLLHTLSEVYVGKVLIVKLGGLQILTQAMLIGNTPLWVKKQTILLLCSLCEAMENIGSFLKGVPEAVMLELSLNYSELIEEFSALVLTVRSEIILSRFLNSSQLLIEGAERTNAYPKALSIIQSALQELRDEGYGNGDGWDW